MGGVKRPPECPISTCRQRVADNINKFFCDSDFMCWDDCGLKAVHNWPGHAGRMDVHDPNRLALRALWLKDYRYLLALHVEHGQQCRGCRLCEWRWARSLCQYGGLDWIQQTVT